MINKLKFFIANLGARFNLYIYSSKWSRNFQVQRELIEQLQKNSEGILHIGAHYGQEAKRYELYNRKVLWVEAIPEIFSVLEKNIFKFKNQKAVLALLGDENINNKNFYLSSNDSSSSSIFNFGNELNFKKLHMQKEIKLDMVRLDSIFNKKDLLDFSHWVIDVQGAELKVLQGAGELLDQCYSAVIEASTRNVYQGGAKNHELTQFMSSQGFICFQGLLPGMHGDVLYLRVNKKL